MMSLGAPFLGAMFMNIKLSLKIENDKCKGCNTHRCCCGFIQGNFTIANVKFNENGCYKDNYKELALKER